MQLSLKDFILTGSIGSLDAGSTTSVLEALCGPPEDRGDGPFRHPVLWKYGDVEFHFTRSAGTLWLIHIDRFSAAHGRPQGSGDLVVDPWIIRQGMMAKILLDALKKASITITMLAGPGNDQETMVLSSGVEIGLITRSDPWSSPVGLASLSRRLGDPI